jgi:AcrR family transcriptional regulator
VARDDRVTPSGPREETVTIFVEAEQDDLPWRERKKLQTREALHDAARSLILEHGTAVTIEEICRTAGVSPRTFFNYYPSKVAAAVGLPGLRISDEQRAAFLAGGPGPIVPDLARLVALVTDAAGGRGPDKATLRELFITQPELRQELMHWLGDARRMFVELAEERVSPERARAAVMLVMAALHGTMENSGGDRQNLESRLLDAVAEMVAAATEPVDGIEGIAPVA